MQRHLERFPDSLVLWLSRPSRRQKCNRCIEIVRLEVCPKRRLQFQLVCTLTSVAAVNDFIHLDRTVSKGVWSRERHRTNPLSKPLYKYAPVMSNLCCSVAQSFGTRPRQIWEFLTSLERPMATVESWDCPPERILRVVQELKDHQGNMKAR